MNDTKTVNVQRDVKAELQRQAQTLREESALQGMFIVNMLSSPGAGKTSLLEATAKHMNARGRRMAVLVGDLETDRDAQRLAPHCPVEQLTTGGACHLEIPLVKKGLAGLRQQQGLAGLRQQQGLKHLGRDDFDFLFIENVGNLVCPASHDLAEHLRVVLLSVTEGDDKPGKYPKMFRTSQAMLISKLDLLEHVPFNVEDATTDAHKIQPDLKTFSVCALDGRGIETWCQYLEECRNHMLEQTSNLASSST